VRAQTLRAERRRDPGERVHVDDTRPQLRELALWEVRVVAVEPLRDDHTQHGVAQELQALVGGQTAVLVRERPVGQRQRQQLVAQVDAEGREQRPAIRHRPGRSVGHRRSRGQAGVTTGRPP
jgi:hypothetical protein